MKKVLITLILICADILISIGLFKMTTQYMAHQMLAHQSIAYNGLVFHLILLNVIVSAGFNIFFRLCNEIRKVISPKRKTQNSPTMTTLSTHPTQQTDLATLGINEAELVKEVFRIYQKIQVAWMNFDYETLKKYTTNELYNMYVSQLNTLKVKKQQNVIENIKFYRGNIMNYQINHNELETISVQLMVVCQDYLIDQTTGQVVRGNKLNTMNYTYKLTLIRRKQTEMKQCPNCGAALESNMTSQCPYCHSVIVHNKFDWILSKKEMLFQAQL